MTAKDFLESLPEKVPAAALEGQETHFHFDLTGETGCQMSVRIKDGAILVEEGLQEAPKCEVKADAEDFMRIIRGELNPMMAMMTGKIKISNVGEMMRYTKMFGLS